MIKTLLVLLNVQLILVIYCLAEVVIRQDPAWQMQRRQEILFSRGK